MSQKTNFHGDHQEFA